MTCEWDRQLELLDRIRDLLNRTGAGVPGGEVFHDAIARFVFGNREIGGPLIEVGCHGGGLTAQLAFIAKMTGSHVFVVDASEGMLSQARSVLDKLSLSTSVSWHLGTLETFAQSVRVVQKPLLLIINGSPDDPNLPGTIRTVGGLNELPHAVAFPDFGPENGWTCEAAVGKAIEDCFGKAAVRIRFGDPAARCREPAIRKHPGTEEGHRLEVNGCEGLLLVPQTQCRNDSGHDAWLNEPPELLISAADSEVGKTHLKRLRTGFYERYMSGKGLDVGYSGYGKVATPIRPGATGVDLDYPGYDGRTLPFPDGSQDYIFASHVLEHIPDYRYAIRDWHRVTKPGGYIVIIVPHQFLYEKRHCLPSLWNRDHKRFYTPGSLLREIEESLPPNTCRIVHLRDNDDAFDYDIPPEKHSRGCYEIECVVKKIEAPAWRLG